MAAPGTLTVDPVTTKLREKDTQRDKFNQPHGKQPKPDRRKAQK